MLESSQRRIEALLRDDASVLDIGGWAEPFARADWVVDLMPFETRGLYSQGPGGERPPAAERFSANTWVVCDACDREPLPFSDNQFDFVVCSHTLEDIRDPIGLCREIVRVGRAGYVEVPSRLEEQAWGVHGPFVGWSHHRRLIDMTDGRLDFLHKPAALQALPQAQVSEHAYRTLSPEARVHALFWEDGFEARERFLFDPVEHDRFLADIPGSEGLSRVSDGRPNWLQKLLRR